MSQSHFRCPKCPERHFSTLLEAVRHVVSEKEPSKHVRCCVKDCPKRVRDRKLRLHIREIHRGLCPWSCSACPAKFVGRKDLKNHRRNGCPRRNLACLASVFQVFVGLRSKDTIETFFENVDFRNSSAVNTFITDKLQLDEDNRKDFSKVVHLLYEYLQHHLSSFSINGFVKGGSVGKGTAVKGKADIDCVVFLNNVKTMRQHKRDLPRTKKLLKSCLNQSPYEDQIAFKKDTPFAVKFDFGLDSSREFDIDLLPTFTTNQSPDQLYNEMIGCTTKDKGYYSAHFVSLQVDFVKGQESIVKDLIRLVKYWRKTCIEAKSNGTTRLPSSYPLELITIDCWEKAEKPKSFDIRAGFKAVLQQLVDNCHIQAIWYDNYNEAIAERASGIKGMKSKRQPFVMDPANPHNNVYSASDSEGWKIVEDVAKMTLEKQPLKDINFNRNWQIKQV